MRRSNGAPIIDRSPTSSRGTVVPPADAMRKYKTSPFYYYWHEGRSRFTRIPKRAREMGRHVCDSRATRFSLVASPLDSSANAAGSDQFGLPVSSLLALIFSPFHSLCAFRRSFRIFPCAQLNVEEEEGIGRREYSRGDPVP